MADGTDQQSELEQEQERGFEHLPVGERLKRAREGKNLTLEDVASRTRIPLRHLNSIEDGNWDALPAVTYAVGFARSYARAVGLDEADIAQELRDQLGSPRPVVTAPEYYEPADPARVPPVTIAIIAAVIAIVLVSGYLIWRAGVYEEAPPPAADVPIADAPAEPAPQQPAGPQPLIPEAAADQPVTLVATEEVWLRIDAADRGEALFQGIMQPGDRYQVPQDAQNPVIRTGRPQVLRVNVGGRDIGTLAPSEQTISGVSLRPADLVQRVQGQTGQAPPPQ